MVISMDADPGVVPPDTILDAKEITSGSANFVIVNNALEPTSDKFIAYDLTLISDGVEIQPDGKVRITMAVPDGFNMNKMVLYHVADDGTLTEIPFTLDKNNKCITFETDHFSMFALSEEKETEEPIALGDVNGDGKITTDDARMALQAALNKINLTSEQETRADVDNTEGVSTDDARLILQRALDKIDCFPKEPCEIHGG
jgi:hypothetical protein